MKKNVLFSVVFLLCNIIAAPAASFDWQWERSIGSADKDQVMKIVTDGAGNVYMAGVFYGPALVLAPGKSVYNSGPSFVGEAYIAKYDAKGALLWAKNGGGYGANHMYLSSLAVDASGNAYIGGTFEGFEADFGSAKLTHSSAGRYMYVLRFDASGNITLAKDMPGGYLNTMTVDGAGNIYFAGVFSNSTLTIGTTTLTNAYFSTDDAFVVKCDASLNPIWVNLISGTEWESVDAMCIAKSGDLLVTGFFNSATTTVGSATLSSNSNSYDFFLARYDGAGNLSWIKSAGGYYDDYTTDIATDASDNIYLSGYFFSPTFSFAGNTVTSTSTSHNKNTMLAKYNASGTELWLKNAGGSGLTDYSYGSSVTVDTANNIYLAGGYSSTSIVFDTLHLALMPNFVVKYNPAGSAIWGRTLEGNDVVSVKADKFGNVYAAGTYAVVFQLDTAKFYAMGDDDIWLAKLGAPASITPPPGAVNPLTRNSIITCYPNPAANSVEIGLTDVPEMVEIFDVAGKICFKAAYPAIPLRVDVSAFPPGAYTVKLISGDKISNERFVITR